MSIDEINQLSLPLLNKLLRRIPERICESLGIPLEPTEEGKEYMQSKKQDDKKYPEKQKVTPLIHKPKRNENQEVYNGNSKQQLMDFFSGLADIQDNE